MTYQNFFEEYEKGFIHYKWFNKYIKYGIVPVILLIILNIFKIPHSFIIVMISVAIYLFAGLIIGYHKKR